MAVGENIQSCRKTLGMSQAELGEKLMVSRQTVSLWETGQTAPTIENLLRLKELFGVSLDELLATGPAEPPAGETYRFHFEEAELRELHRLARREDCKALFRYFPAGLLTLSLLLGAGAPWPWGIAALVLFLCGGIPRLAALRRYEKSFQNSVARICATTYEYRLFDGYFLLTLYRDGEKVRESRCGFGEIEALRTVGPFLVLQFGGQRFFLRKRDLREDSAFYSYLFHHPEHPKAPPPVPRDGANMAATRYVSRPYLCPFCAGFGQDQRLTALPGFYIVKIVRRLVRGEMGGSWAAGGRGIL